MTPRQEHLLRTLVEAYTATAEPISSAALLHMSNLDVSPATVRNDLAALEEQGMVISPHTSAGRIPTEKGYQYYISQFLQAKKAAQRERQRLALEANAKTRAMKLRKVTKALSELTGEAVILSLAPKQTFTTGISRLFAKPEFHSLEMVQHVSQMMDAVDSHFDPLYDKTFDDVKIMIGSESPFGESLASLIISYDDGSGRGLLSIVGPMRMNYARNAALLKEAQRLLSNL